MNDAHKPARRWALALLAALAWRPGQATPLAPGALVPWPDVKLLDGSTLRAAQLSGRAAVVVFWSTTCPFCRRHNQHLEKLHRAAAGKPLTVLAVSRDRNAADVARYASAQGYSFPISMDYAGLSALLSTRNVIPLTITIDRQGRLKQVIPGEMFEEDLLEMLQLAA
jgi:thiol-disulfide isomerase/thioredoxin